MKKCLFSISRCFDAQHYQKILDGSYYLGNTLNGPCHHYYLHIFAQRFQIAKLGSTKSSSALLHSHPYLLKGFWITKMNIKTYVIRVWIFKGFFFHSNLLSKAEGRSIYEIVCSLNTIALIQQPKFFLFVFPLKQSFKNDFKGEIASKIQFRPT